jgi:hypothetical membrane protein
MKNTRILGLFGLIGVIVYLVLILIAASQLPGYSHASEYLSNLGAIGQPSATMAKTAGILAGICFILFGISTFSAFKKDWKGIVGGVLLLVEGIFQIILALFPCEPGCNAVEPIMSESIHNMVGPSAFILLSIALLFWAFRFRKQDQWHSFWLYTLISGILAIVFFLVFGMSVGTPIVGIWQRLLRGTLYLWIAIFSYRLWSNWDLGPFMKS